MTKIILATAFAVIALVGTSPHIVKFVQAEDDCAFGTYSVTRLPLVGLVCIIEGSDYE